MWGANALLLSKKLWALSTLLTVGLCSGVEGREGRRWVDGEMCSGLSDLPVCGPLVHLMLGVAQPVFSFFFPEEFVPCSCSFGVFVGGGEFRILLLS